MRPARMNHVQILMLGPHPSVKGPIPKHTPLLIQGLEEAGCRVTYLVWGRHSDQEGPVAKTLGRGLDIGKAYRELGRVRYDALVVKTAHYAETLTRDVPLLGAVRGRARLRVIQFHGSNAQRFADMAPGAPFRSWSGRLLSLAHGSLVLSTEEVETWRRYYPDHPFQVVKNPYVPVPALGAPREPRPAGAPPRLLFTGRLLEGKGIFELVEAFAALRRERAVTLTIAGDGPEADALRRRIDELGLAGDVTLAGWLDGDGLARAYREADVFVLPTKLYEGFPTSITEAMQAGLPIVTTRLRGAADHLREGVHAYFPPAGDAEGLRAALARLLDDPERMAAMGKSNRLQIKAFEKETVAREYLEAIAAIGEARGIPFPRG